MALAMLLALLPAGAAAENAKGLTDRIEVGLTFGAENGVGYESWAPTARFGLSGGSDTLRVRASTSWAGVHKGVTPSDYSADAPCGSGPRTTLDGYSVGASWGGEVQVGRAHAFAGASYHFTDQTVWTKRVHYVFGGVGWRWSNRWTGHVPREIVNAELAYSQETFSTYANDVRSLQASVAYDYRLRPAGPLCVRLAVSLGGMQFKENPYPGAKKSQGTSLLAVVGLAWRK